MTCETESLRSLHWKPLLPTLLLIPGTRHSSLFSLSISLQFSANVWCSDKPVTSSWEPGALSFLTLQCLPPAAPACSLCSWVQPPWPRMACSVLLPWAVSTLTSKLRLISSLQCQWGLNHFQNPRAGISPSPTRWGWDNQDNLMKFFYLWSSCDLKNIVCYKYIKKKKLKK